MSAKSLPSSSKLGDRRVLVDREQVCIGPCRRCGEPVWLYVDAARKDEPPIHKRICAEMERC